MAQQSGTCHGRLTWCLAVMLVLLTCSNAAHPAIFVGCYGDTSTRALSTLLGSVNTQDACYALSIQRGFTYWGVQNCNGECPC